MICRADAQGMTVAELRDVLTDSGLTRRQTTTLLAAGRATYGPHSDCEDQARAVQRGSVALTAI